jgi:GTP pyrophosphokinase
MTEEEQTSLVLKAARFAQQKHGSQLDDDGKNYFDTHIVQVFQVLCLITNDTEVIAAGLLHDTIEDTDTTYEELVQEFGVTIADLVMEVTHEGHADNIGYYFPRLASKRGIMIKFADRLSNLSRMDNWPQKRQQQYLKKSKFWKNEV